MRNRLRKSYDYSGINGNGLAVYSGSSRVGSGQDAAQRVIQGYGLESGPRHGLVMLFGFVSDQVRRVGAVVLIHNGGPQAVEDLTTHRLVAGSRLHQLAVPLAEAQLLGGT